MTAASTAMILAAGLGTRLLPLTKGTPKPLIKVGNKALIDYHLERLAKAGFRRIVINASYLSEQIVAHLEGLKTQAVFSRTTLHVRVEAQPLETGGALVNASDLLGDGPILVISGDAWVDLQPNELQAITRRAVSRLEQECDAVLFMTNNPAHNACGDFEIRNGFAQSFIASDNQACDTLAQNTKTYTGLGVFSLAAFNRYPRRRAVFPLREYFKHLIDKRCLGTMTIENTWFDVGTPARLGECENFISARG